MLLAPVLLVLASGPPPADGSNREKPWLFGIEVRMPLLTGEPTRFNPPVGVGIGAHIQRSLRPWFALRIAVDYDRVFRSRPVLVPELGIEVTRNQALTATSFLVEAVFRATRRWFTAHLAVGSGLYLAFYKNAEVEESKKVDLTSILPGLRLEAGLSFRLHASFSLGLALGYDFRRDTRTVPDPGNPSGPRVRPFDDQMALSLRFDYLF